MRVGLLVVMLVAMISVRAESEQIPQEFGLIDECPFCTEEERDWRELAKAQAMVEQLNQLVQQIEMLAANSEAAEVLLSNADTAVPLRILSTVRAIQEQRAKAAQQQKIAVVAPTQAATKKRSKQAPPAWGLLNGLTPGFAETDNEDLAIKASAVVVSHGQPIPLRVGQKFTHNKKRFELAAIVSREDAKGVLWHNIVLRGPNSSTHILKWK